MCLGVVSFAQDRPSEFSPKASEDAQVLFGKARFTVLTPRLVRMEWSADSQFEDRATLGIVNRDLEVPSFDIKKSKSQVVIKTSQMTLTYTGQDKFAEGNLSISFKMADPKAKKGTKTVTWRPGMDDSGNLLSTTRTLDKCDGISTLEPYDKGVLSRDGWAVIWLDLYF